ncbi:MAG: GldG family protein [Betaproteobacteria bacterium]|nr:GldG family protein [Betaproteobacteria bacterium]
MEITRRFRIQLLAQNALFVALFLALIGLAGYFAREYRTQWDVTASHRNSLTAASLEVLKQLKGAVRVTVYSHAQQPRAREMRKEIAELVGAYQRARPDISLTFVDPAENPKLAEQAGIKADGELTVEYDKRRERLLPGNINERDITNLLMRLVRRRELLVMYLDGHGERRLDGIANHDLGEFGKQLLLKGFGINRLNLTVAPEVPANAAVLVISNPQVDLLPGELDRLVAYVNRGGNLFWLIDQEPLHGLAPLAQLLGLTLTPGVVVDPSAQRLNALPTWALASSYGRHPVTQNFNLITVFPFSRSIGAGDDQGWRVANLVEAAQQGWVETGELDRSMKFDKNRDTPGPVPIAVALTRSVNDREQRVVVVGNGYFLANTFVGNGGNMDLGINIMNWLAGDDSLIAVQPRGPKDPSLDLTTGSALTITATFLIGLPLAFLATAAALWWRRRKL